MKLQTVVSSILVMLVAGMYSGNHSSDNASNKKSFGEIAKEESLVPIRPGKPGRRPFWDIYAKRFIYAPAFNFQEIKGANKYRYEIQCMNDSSTYIFENSNPYAPLSPVWAKMPVGYFRLRVVGISNEGDSVGLAGEGKYYRVAYFNGPYHKAIIPYDSSGILAIKRYE